MKIYFLHTKCGGFWCWGHMTNRTDFFPALMELVHSLLGKGKQ